MKLHDTLSWMNERASERTNKWMRARTTYALCAASSLIRTLKHKSVSPFSLSSSKQHLLLDAHTHVCCIYSGVFINFLRNIFWFVLFPFLHISRVLANLAHLYRFQKIQNAATQCNISSIDVSYKIYCESHFRKLASIKQLLIASHEKEKKSAECEKQVELRIMFVWQLFVVYFQMSHQHRHLCVFQLIRQFVKHFTLHTSWPSTPQAATFSFDLKFHSIALRSSEAAQMFISSRCVYWAYVTTYQPLKSHIA